MGLAVAAMDEADFADMVEQTPVRTYVIEYREPSLDGGPGKLVGAFIFFPMLGFGINVLSLLGLVLAIGIVVADFHNPLFTEFADLARQAFAARGIFCFIATASISIEDGVERIDPVPIQHMLDLKPSSLLIVGGLADHTPFKNISDKLPIVQVLSSKGDLKRAVSVRCNEERAMKLVLDHLQSLGHSNIVYIGPAGER